MQDNRELSIVIVNYNKYNLTQKCIQSVLDSNIDYKYEIIVLDNASPNESYDELKRKYINVEHISVIKSSKNNGFGDGNNQAVELAKYKNILLLNPDVIVKSNSISVMLGKLLEDETIGLIGCKLLNEDNTLQYSCRRFIKLRKFILARTPLKKIVKKEKIKAIDSEYLMKDYSHEETMDVDWLMGSCLMIRKSDFQRVGGFSKEYFMYFEDVDLAYKVKQISKRIVYEPSVEMIHLHEQESVKGINKLTIIHFQSMLKFYFKYLKSERKKIKLDKEKKNERDYSSRRIGDKIISSNESNVKTNGSNI